MAGRLKASDPFSRWAAKSVNLRIMVGFRSADQRVILVSGLDGLLWLN